MTRKILSPLPIGSVIPDGIIRDFLKTQMDGLTGHISAAGYPFNTPKWGEEYISETEWSKWWVYEQCGYWIDGLVRTAILTEDRENIERAKKIIYNVLEKPDSEGYLGPIFMKETLPDDSNRWAHVVFFRACIALYEYTQDRKIVEAIRKHYLNVKTDFSFWRDVLNVEIMLWAYAQTGDRKLLELAEYWYGQYNEKTDGDLCDRVALSDKKPFEHGVSYNEYSKLGAILYEYTGKEIYLQASRNAFKKVDQYFMLPSGCFCSNEYTVSNDYMKSYETCDISDYTWSLGYLFGVTADADYMDKLEKCVFNAGVGSVLENFRGLQYFSSANQVIADRYSNQNDLYCGDKWMSYRPNPGTECCPGNVNRFMPNYVYRQYYGDCDGNLYSVLFGAGRLSYKGITIEQKTDFPFRTEVGYTVKTDHPFVLYIRVPGWAKGIRFELNGEERAVSPVNSFIPVEIKKDAKIRVAFRQEIEKHFCDNGVWFSRGPLVYALGVRTRREIDTEEERSTEEFPAYNMYADSEWRYGVDPDSELKFVEGESAGWSLCETLPKIELNGLKLKNWDFDRRTTVIRAVCEAHPDLHPPRPVNGNFVFTPRIPETPEPDGEQQKITLYPYGLCKLRITVFPIVKNQ